MQGRLAIQNSSEHLYLQNCWYTTQEQLQNGGVPRELNVVSGVAFTS
jgi:hypothetical protein